MSKTAPKHKRIGKHDFRLVGRQELYFKGEHTVSFKPLPKSKQNKERSILPKFNHDRKFYTYAFQLPSCPPDNDDQLLEEHQKRATQSLAELSQLLMPKPRSRHKYCGVCRGHYEDYKEHIEGEPHLGHLRVSPYQELINKMAANYLSSQDKTQNEEVKIIDLTAEESAYKVAPEMVQTLSTSKPILG